MRPEDVLNLQLVDSSERALRIGDVSISVEFFLLGTRRYGFRLGPTDENGHIRVTYYDVEQRRLANLNVQPCDYKTRLEECDRRVRVSVPTQGELDAAVRIATSFNMGVTPPDAEQWMRASNRCVSCAPIEIELVGEVSLNMPCV
jgi:hypothetical protein